MKTLLACIDDSLYTPSVVDHAAWAAKRMDAQLEMMHTLERHPERASTPNLSGSIGLGAKSELLAELAALDEQRSKLSLQHGRALLAAAAERARQQGATKVHERLRHGDLIDALVEFESTYDLLVMGKRGASADMARLHLGSNLEQAVRAIHRPILVASRAFKPIERLLLAFDGSTSARKAVELVATSALLAGLGCDLVMAGAESTATRAHLAWAQERLDASGVDARVELLPGHAEVAIADRVRSGGVDLLVMGASGHSRIRQLIVGSTTRTMIRSCLVPVLLVR